MIRPHYYENEYLDMGELGEHALEITYINTGRMDEPVNISILRAIAKYKRNGILQCLDVTPDINTDDTWIERCKKAYEAKLQPEYDEGA